MTITRVLVLLFACLLPWQAAQADVSAVQAEQMAAEMAGMPCHSAGADCCDDNCPQMSFCVTGVAMCAPTAVKISGTPQDGRRLPLWVQSPKSAIPEHPLRPPILLAV
ncbi:MAG: hypothetical protein ACOY9J_12995 [Pseudomonadota bacterium]